MKSLGAVLALALAVAGPGPRAESGASAARVEAYFTPGDDVDRVIAGRIALARQSVRVQAYLFTNRRIATALASAARRGVAVDLVADARQHEAGAFPVIAGLDRAGVRVWLNGDHAAFHNKVVLIDAGAPGATVITGSYNFTQAAQERNAENIVVISASPAIADRFAGDFERHRARASRLQ